MKPQWKFFFFVALIILALDHLTKLWIVQNVAIGDGFDVIPNLFDIVHLRNKGAAFGFLNSWHSPARNAFFYIMGVVAFFCIMLFYKNTPKEDRISSLAFALIAGGACGNLSDRFLRGSVVDFLSVHYYDHIWQPTLFGQTFSIPLTWPAFNVADSAITIAIILLLWRTLVCSYKKA